MSMTQHDTIIIEYWHRRLQVILGIIFPPAILLLDFRLGDEASTRPNKNNEDRRTKDEDNKSSKVTTLQNHPCCSSHSAL